MRRTCALLVLLLATAAGCSSGGDQAGTTSSRSAAPATATPTPGSSTPSATPVADGCGSQFLASLSPRQKLAQLLTVGVSGTADALDVVRNEQVGGIFIGGWTDRDLLAGRGVDQVRTAAKIAPMVTIDEEGGRVSRVRDIIGPAPSAREAAQTMTADQYYQQSLDRGKQLRNLGITVNFAPDVDVSSQPDDTVIGDRSFSDDPAKVTEYAGAYIRAMHEAGVQAVIKHFPGHGSGSGDSHTGAVTTPPLQQLQGKDLLPFRDLVTSGVGAMVGHLDVPGLTTPGVPASISPAAMQLLRTGTGYGAPPFLGPIFTDDLSGMQAIAARMGIAEAVRTALEAGADVALWISTDAVPAVLDTLTQAVQTGALSQQRVDESVLRVAKFKGVINC